MFLINVMRWVYHNAFTTVLVNQRFSVPSLLCASPTERLRLIFARAIMCVRVCFARIVPAETMSVTEMVKAEKMFSCFRYFGKDSR